MLPTPTLKRKTSTANVENDDSIQSMTSPQNGNQISNDIPSRRRTSNLVTVVPMIIVALTLYNFGVHEFSMKNMRSAVTLLSIAPEFEVVDIIKKRQKISFPKDAPLSKAIINALEWSQTFSEQALKDSQTNKLSAKKLSTPPPRQGADYETHFQGYKLKFIDEANYSENYARKSDKNTKSKAKFCGLAKEASLLYPDLYPKSHALNQDSVVLVTGILNKLGFNLALQLAIKCNVKVIAGIDPAFPHFTSFRAGLLQQMNILSKQIPGFIQPFVIPYFGLSPNYDFLKKFQPFFSPTTGEIDYNKALPKQITHVVHLIPSDPYTYRDLEENYKERINEDSHLVDAETGKTSPAFSLTQNIYGMEHILSTLTSDSKAPIHFTFVSETDLLDESSYSREYKKFDTQNDSSDEKEEQKHRNFHTVTNIMNELIFQYHGRTSKHALVGLRLPRVYGPWDKSGSLFHDLMQQAIKSWNSPTDDLHRLVGNKGFGNDPFDLLYVDDALNAIIAAMQYRDTKSPSIFNVLSGEKTTASDFAELVQAHIPNSPDTVKSKLSTYTPFDLSKPPSSAKKTNEYLQWTPKTNVVKGIRQTLAFHLNADAGGDHTVGNFFLRTNDEPTCSEDDIICFRGLEPKLCASECSIQDFCLKDPNLELALDISVKRTEKCDLVVYTAPLGSEIFTIRAKFEEGGKNKDNTKICGIAYVSSGSTLVNTILDNDSSNKTSKRDKINSMENAFTSNGWQLVVVDTTESNVSVYKDLLKLSPGKAFASSVKNAMYVDNSLPVTITNKDALFTASLLKRNSKDHNWSKTYKSNSGAQVQYDIQKGSRSAILVAPALRLEQEYTDDENGESPPPPPATINNIQQAVAYMSRRISNPLSGNSNRQKDAYSLSVPFLNRDEFGEDQGLALIKHKIRHWITSEWLMHDLEKPKGKSLRCEWYNEHSFWNADLDETSFAFVMALRDLKLRRTVFEPTMPIDSSMVDKTKEINQWYLAANSEEMKNFQKYDILEPSETTTTVRIIDDQSLNFERVIWDGQQTVSSAAVSYDFVMHEGVMKKRYKRKIVRRPRQQK